MGNLREATASGRQELPYLGLLDVSRALRSGRFSATEVTQVLLDRIAELDPVLRSYTTVTASRAMARAAQADAELGKGLWRGPLHGVPIAVKDLCRTSYASTAAGMAMYRDAAPSSDCTVVARLEQAGAVVLGKLTMTEGAFSGHHPAMPTPINPFSPGSWTGASSSGSGVATAAGLCFASLGSDTGGSIRFPSAACGLTGLKPTWGRVSRHGVFALADSLDHIGPMTRSAEDAAAVLGVIAGADPHDPTALQAPVPDYLAEIGGGIRGMRIGLDESFAFDGLDGDVATSLRLAIEALGHLGARLVPIRFPPIEAVLQAFTPLCSVECAIAHEATYPGRAGEYGPQLAAWIETGRKVSAAELGKAMQQRLVFCGQVAEVFGSLDAIVTPVMPTTIPSLERWAAIAGSDGTDADFSGVLRFTSPFDMTGSPTLTLPGDPDRTGVPIGFQLIGPHLSEAALLRAGHALQQITDWHTRRPDLGAHGSDIRPRGLSTTTQPKETAMHTVSIPPEIIERSRRLRGDRPHIFATVDPARTAHVVVDLQNGFMSPGAPVEVPIAREIVPNVNMISDQVRRAGGLNVFLRYTYDEAERFPWPAFYKAYSTPENTAMMKAAFTRGAEHHGLWAGLDVKPGDLIVDKTRFSGFIAGTCDLHDLLQRRGIDTLIITGTVTNCCCESTARDAMQMDYKIIFVSDGNAAFTDAEHNATLSSMVAIFADVMTADDVVAALGSGRLDRSAA